MKIIAEVPLAYNSKNYIVEMSDQELANLIGFYSANTQGASVYMKTGMVVQVHEMFKRLYAWRRFGEDLEDAKKNLLEMAANLEPLKGIVKPLESPTEMR